MLFRSLLIVRNKLDKLDDKLINLIKIRTNLVNEVVKLKKKVKELLDTDLQPKQQLP